MRCRICIAMFGALSLVAQETPRQGGSKPTSQQAPAGLNNPVAKTGAPGNKPNDTSASKTRINDSKFVHHAALGGLTQIELGRLAAQKGNSDAVKQFGQRMVEDHTKVHDRLKQVAAQENISVPASLDSKRQSRVDKLARRSGASFDKAFVKDQVKNHDTDVPIFRLEAEMGGNPAVRDFAAQALPTLEQHQKTIKSLDIKH